MKYIVIIPLIIFLFSCSEPKTMLQPLNDFQPILAFGDSLTFGYGAAKNESYPAQLSKIIDKEIINEGINGELSRNGLNRLEKILDKHQPQLLLLCHGANDMLQKRNLDNMADNLRAMILLAQQRDIQVVLFAVPNTTLLLSPIKQYQEVADEMNVIVDNELFADILKQPKLHSDLVHPNALGYRQIAERIAQLLADHGAIN